MNRKQIENPAAYAAAIEARIKRNAAKTRSKKWLAVEGNSRLYDWLMQTGEFAEETKCNLRTHEEHMFPDALPALKKPRPLPRLLLGTVEGLISFSVPKK